MATWGIAEWYGRDILEMSPVQRRSAAEHALAAHTTSIKIAPQPECPFMSSIRPGALCNKVGGVCSIRQYEESDPVTVVDAQPTTLCPSRFLETRADATVFSHISQELYGIASGAKVIKEVPFLLKETRDGQRRGAKAGRIDWVLVPKPLEIEDASQMDWVAIETQGVYFSGDEIWPDIEAYWEDPTHVHFPTGKRHPDYRSSGAKRLSPQLDAKSPVMNRWGRKVVVVVDSAFFNEMGALVEADDFDNSEVVWVIVRYSANMVLEVDSTRYSELKHARAALQAAKPVNKTEFENDLRKSINSPPVNKVFNV